MDIAARFYRPPVLASATIILAVDRNQPALLSLARSLIGFAARLRVSLTLAVDEIPSRLLMSEFLASGLDCELAMWGRADWTRTNNAHAFFDGFAERERTWHRLGFTPHTFVADGQAYYRWSHSLARLGVQTVVPANWLTRRGRIVPRAIGAGIVETSLTHRGEWSAKWWQPKLADVLKRSVEAGEETRWLTRLSRIDGNMFALRELRNLIAQAGNLERRGHLLTRPVTPGFANPPLRRAV